MKAPGEKTPAEATSAPPFKTGETANTPPSEDLEQIRWALSLTPEERLAVLQDFVDTFWTPDQGPT